MLSQDHEHSIRHQLFRFKYTELNEIFAFMSMRAFAISLVAIFIPIYLYNLGVTLSNIFLFYIVTFLVELAFEYPAALGIKKFGPKHLIAFSVPFLIVHLFLLLTLEKYGWPLWLVAATAGATLSFFWQAYHYDFSRSRHRKKTSREVGRHFIALATLGSLAPLLGGLVATRYGIDKVFLIAIMLLMGATMILFKTSDKNFKSERLDFSKIKFKKIKRDLFAYSGSMIEFCSSGQIWPLFLFIIVKSYERVGLITSAALVITIFVTYRVSKKSDAGERIHYLRFGGYLNAIIGGLRVWAETALAAFGFNLAKNVASSYFSSPFTSEYYLHADESSRSEYIFLMESMNDFAKVAYYSLLYVLSLLYTDSTVLIMALLLGAVGAYASTWMPPSRCEVCSPISNKAIKVQKRIGG